MQSPEKVFKDLFVDLHLSGLWDDVKVITDAIPMHDPEIILDKYAREKQLSNFDLKAFFNNNFKFSKTKAADFNSDRSLSVSAHIQSLWSLLERKADKKIEGSSLIPLPYPYIVPGGRFNEIYYWDSFFTMLGLVRSQRTDIVESMINNFAWLIDNYGFIPNGNRTYFLGRSQPPFFALMVSLLATEKGDDIYIKYLNQLKKEYKFWMKDSQHIDSKTECLNHVVYLNEEVILNRYFDQYQSPRPEMYADDYELGHAYEGNANELYINIRAACESGWDFSARWFENPNDLNTIKCAQILPVDLNCLLFYLEETIAKGCALKGDQDQANIFLDKSKARMAAIQNIFWSSEKRYYYDYNFESKELCNVKSLAGVYPLYFNIASEEQAKHVANTLEADFLHSGGLVSTPIYSGQQWDAPNGWAPLQYMAVKGLQNYGYDELANIVKERWMSLNEKVFKNTGKMLEKYNVVDTELLSGGGEYPVQDGFGWTNGVYLAFQDM